jgi:Protein of unknown function (DUF3626)
MPSWRDYLSEQRIIDRRKTVQYLLPYYASIGKKDFSSTIDQETLSHYLQYLMDQGEIVHRLTLTDLAKVIRDGYFKTLQQIEKERQAQVRPRLKLYDLEKIRKEAEAYFFGIPYEYNEERPLYAELRTNTSTSATGHYGEIQLVLRPSLRSRATCTRKDSLLLYVEVEPIGTENSLNAAFPMENIGWEWLGYDALHYSAQEIQTAQNLDDLRALLGSDYVEAQIHGTVFVSDIEKVIAKSDIIFSQDILEWLQQNHIPLVRTS